MELKKVNKDQLRAPVMQDPMIYQRILNHPEFVFPTYFKAKPGARTEASKLMQNLIAQKLKSVVGAQLPLNVGGGGGSPNKKGGSHVLDDRQDTVYYSQDFANRWSKIELMTNKQIKKGKKGL